MTVQPLGDSELSSARAIEACCFNDPWSIDLWLRYLTDSFVLVDKGQLLAYAQCSTVLDEAELLRIAVHPDVQGGGYGKKLLMHLGEVLADKGVHRLMLEVRESNFIAIALYKSCGMQRDGCRPGYYETSMTDQRENALLFSLNLSVKEQIE